MNLEQPKKISKNKAKCVVWGSNPRLLLGEPVTTQDNYKWEADQLTTTTTTPLRLLVAILSYLDT